MALLNWIISVTWMNQYTSINYADQSLPHLWIYWKWIKSSILNWPEGCGSLLAGGPPSRLVLTVAMPEIHGNIKYQKATYYKLSKIKLSKMLSIWHIRFKNIDLLGDAYKDEHSLWIFVSTVVVIGDLRLVTEEKQLGRPHNCLPLQCLNK